MDSLSPDSLAASGIAALDTFPKLLLDHAKRNGDKPANREKDYGIWQSWSWRQVADEVAALANGLAAMGFRRGDKLTIIGDNRPRSIGRSPRTNCPAAFRCRSITMPGPTGWASASTLPKVRLP